MTQHALRDFAHLFAERFIATRCSQVAGSLAFTTLLALVPLITVAIALFGNRAGFEQLGESLREFLLNNLLPDRAGHIIATYAIQFSEKAAELTVIGTALLFVTALLLLLTIDRVFNHIWGVRRPRPLLTRLTVYWFALTLGPVALGGSAWATGHLIATSVAYAGEGSWLSQLTARALPPILLGGLFSFLYFAVPNHPVRFLHALAGGVATALALVLMQRLFGLFIARFPTYTLIYGAFAVLPIFLLWLYLCWIIVLVGALLSATLPAFVESRSTIIRAFPGDRAWTAVNLLMALAEGQREGRSTPFDTLRERVEVASDMCEALLGDMREAGWVAQTDDGEWLLTRHADRIGLADVVTRFALSPAEWEAASDGQQSGPIAGRLREALRRADVSLAALVSTDPAETLKPGKDQPRTETLPRPPSAIPD